MISTLRIVLTSVILSMAASAATAADFDMSLFGHQVEVSRTGDEQYKLKIDGIAVLTNYYVDLEQMNIVGGVPVIVGTSSAGGNACEGSPFIVSFPKGEQPKVDGPIDSCYTVKVTVNVDSITLATPALPNKPGQKWTWTPVDGLKEIKGDQYVPDSSKGWVQLREKTVGHPSALYDYAVIGAEIDRLAGTDKALVSDILMGVGSASFHGDLLVGTSCSRHMCNEQEAVVVADIPTKAVYLAWKPSGQKIKVNPPVTVWPEKAKAELRSWAAKWK